MHRQDTRVNKHTAYLFAIHNAPKCLDEVVTCLVHTHFRQHISMVVAAALISQNVGHTEQGAGAEPTLNLGLHPKHKHTHTHTHADQVNAVLTTQPP